MTNPRLFAGLALLVVLAAGVLAWLVPVPAESGLRPLAEWRLPPGLREVSGLTLLDDHHVLTVTDESAEVYAVNLLTGAVTDYLVPAPPISEDFEGIARQGAEIFLITSKGRLYHFTGRGGDADFHTLETGLRDTCEIEGLTLDAGDLLIACKTNYRKADAGKLLLFRFVPAERRLLPLFDIPISGTFNLSAIAAGQDSFYLLAARQDALIVLSRDGEILRLIKLVGHPQAEGIAVMPDGRVVIADEGKKQGGKLTVYPPDWLVNPGIHQ